MYFSVLEPSVAETPVVVEVPHAGLGCDPLALATLAAPARALGRDADLYVDRLFEGAPRQGATLLVAHVSRYVCDLNRAEDDVDSLAVAGLPPRASPHGLIWRSTTDGLPALTEPLQRAELERRLTLIYRPYHAQLQALLQKKAERFGHAILLCAHSMPSRGRSAHRDPGQERADVVPGSRGRSSAHDSVIDGAEELARRHGLSVAHDQPYKGGFSTGHYGRPRDGLHALQLELARRLYMDEVSLSPRAESFARTRRYCDELVALLGRLRPPKGSAGP